MTTPAKVRWHNLNAETQFTALGIAEKATGRSLVLLEKDIWVVWTLNALFTACAVHVGQQPTATHAKMVFKGGTSLSKAYGYIDRFSEDIDITLELPGKGGKTPPDIRTCGRNERDRYRDEYRKLCLQFIEDVVLPALRTQAQHEGCPLTFELDITDPATPCVWVDYPTATPAGQNYVQKRVKLEFGARSIITPSDWVQVPTYLSQVPQIVAQVDLPSALPAVLSAERTFLEKATALHALCGVSPQDEAKLQRKCVRFARHLHDLCALDACGVATRAMGDAELLEDVVATKQAFFQEKGADYDLCLEDGIRLLPEGRLRELLAEDYQDMQASGMLGNSQATFDSLLVQLESLQSRMRALRTPELVAAP